MNLGNLKKIGGTALLVLTAFSAAMDVINADKKEKEFEAMKKQLAELTEKK